MNLDNDKVFAKELLSRDLTMEDFSDFLETFGTKQENPFPEELDLRKTYVLQCDVFKTINYLDMDFCDVGEALTELLIANS